MDRPPVGIKDRRKVNELIADETRKNENYRSKRKRERRQYLIRASADQEQRCNTGTERKRDAES